MKSLSLAAAVTVFTVGTLPAQELTAIRAGRLVDVEQGRVLANQVILVRGERIEAVQPASAPMPRGARIVDLSRYTVLPGLIDLHSHLVGDIASASPTAPLTKSGAEDALAGVRNARATLMAGFTTVQGCRHLPCVCGCGVAECDQRRDRARSADAGRGGVHHRVERRR